MSDDELDAIAARAEAATPGQWIDDDAGDVYWAGGSVLAGIKHPGQYPFSSRLADAAFIAAARTDIPALVAEVRRLRELLAVHKENE